MATTYRIKIKGIAPLLQNRLCMDMIKELGQVEKTKKEKWEDDNWERKLYKDSSGNIIWPGVNIQSFLKTCAQRYSIAPPKSIGKTWTNYVKSSFFAVSPAIIKGSKPEKFGRLVTTGTKSKVYVCTPRILEWETELVICDVADSMPEETVKNLIGFGGHFVGLSDWRPQNGRFNIVSFKVEK